MDYVNTSLTTTPNDEGVDTLNLLDPVDWIQANFYIPETNAPIQLVPYQQAMIREALRRDENGLFIYSFVLWSDIKKSAKSTIAGAIALYLAWHTAWESVRIVANDLKQANSRTFFYIERAIKLNPYLREQCAMKTYHIELPNHTMIDAIPVDPKGEAGGGDLATVFTEMWAMKNKASQTLWSETTLSPLKFGKSIRLGESYAGFKGESPILEPLYETGVKGGQQLDLSFEGNDLHDLEVYRNGRMLTLWNKQPRCPWQTKEYYAQEADVLTPSEMSRMHGNVWSASSEAFIPIEWWDGCPKLSNELRPRQGVVLAIDAAVESDCFAIVMVSTTNGVPQVRYARAWLPVRGEQINFSEPEAEIRRLIKTYNIEAVAYDPYQLADMAQRLGDLAFWEKFTQGAPRAIADKRLYDILRDQRIEHGDEPTLRQHIINADRKPEDENKLRIIKREQTRKIDLVVALSMAVDRALYYNL